MARKARRTYPDLKTYFKDSRVHGDTQVKLAERLNRTQAWVSRVVNGITEPSILEALEISRQTSVPLESLSTKRETATSLSETENRRV